MDDQKNPKHKLKLMGMKIYTILRSKFLFILTYNISNFVCVKVLIFYHRSVLTFIYVFGAQKTSHCSFVYTQHTFRLRNKKNNI